MELEQVQHKENQEQAQTLFFQDKIIWYQQSGGAFVGLTL